MGIALDRITALNTAGQISDVNAWEKILKDAASDPALAADLQSIQQKFDAEIPAKARQEIARVLGNATSQAAVKPADGVGVKAVALQAAADQVDKDAELKRAAKVRHEAEQWLADTEPEFSAIKQGFGDLATHLKRVIDEDIQPDADLIQKGLEKITPDKIKKLILPLVGYEEGAVSTLLKALRERDPEVLRNNIKTLVDKESLDGVLQSISSPAKEATSAAAPAQTAATWLAAAGNQKAWDDFATTIKADASIDPTKLKTAIEGVANPELKQILTQLAQTAGDKLLPALQSGDMTGLAEALGKTTVNKAPETAAAAGATSATDPKDPLGWLRPYGEKLLEILKGLQEYLDCGDRREQLADPVKQRLRDFTQFVEKNAPDDEVRKSLREAIVPQIDAFGPTQAGSLLDSLGNIAQFMGLDYEPPRRAESSVTWLETVNPPLGSIIQSLQTFIQCTEAERKGLRDEVLGQLVALATFIDQNAPSPKERNQLLQPLLPLDQSFDVTDARRILPVLQALEVELRAHDLPPNIRDTIKALERTRDDYQEFSVNNYDDILSLIDSSLPIDLVLCLVLLKIAERQREKIKLKIKELSAAEAFEAANSDKRVAADIERRCMDAFPDPTKDVEFMKDVERRCLTRYPDAPANDEAKAAEVTSKREELKEKLVKTATEGVKADREKMRVRLTAEYEAALVQARKKFGVPDMTTAIQTLQYEQNMSGQFMQTLSAVLREMQDLIARIIGNIR
jgi:hypothetical protein